MQSVSYRGETIELARSYASYVEYRDDPSNLAPKELAHVATLVKAARIPSSFANSDEARTALLSVKFPGYGLWTPSQQGALQLYGVEVPGAREIRWVTTVASPEGIFVMDDFVWALNSGDIKRFELEGSQLRYFDATGKVLRAHIA